jgi:hypothetical protein
VVRYSEAKSILARTTQPRPTSLPFCISSHSSRFFSTA